MSAPMQSDHLQRYVNNCFPQINSTSTSSASTTHMHDISHQHNMLQHQQQLVDQQEPPPHHQQPLGHEEQQQRYNQMAVKQYNIFGQQSTLDSVDTQAQLMFNQQAAALLSGHSDVKPMRSTGEMFYGAAPASFTNDGSMMFNTALAAVSGGDVDRNMANNCINSMHDSVYPQFTSSYGNVLPSMTNAAHLVQATVPSIRYPSSLAMAAGMQTTLPTVTEADTDPRELERFAEHFKQRRIKLGVTQADVGKALQHLKMPGVGSLSQSTICRFESLTLSHNNMVALKPILHSWLQRAEEASKCLQSKSMGLDNGQAMMNHGILPNMDKKRKRTSIAAPEKRSLEAYFSLQPRPSGEKIAAIAEKLDLKKNVVRVWFCNQRQKQKRWAERHQHLQAL